ncbi:MAG: tetratricopeptide repeat protein [Spirochaetota bacterium]
MKRFTKKAMIYIVALGILFLWHCGPSESDTKQANELTRKGLLALRTGNKKEALAAFKKANELLPKNPRYINNIGVALMEQDKHKEAKSYFNQAVQLSPTYSRAYFNMGICNTKLKDYKSAVFSYLTAARINPSAPQVYFNLAIVYEKMGDRKKAIKSLQRFLALAPPVLKKARVDAKQKLASLSRKTQQK